MRRELRNVNSRSSDSAFASPASSEDAEIKFCALFKVLVKGECQERESKPSGGPQTNRTSRFRPHRMRSHASSDRITCYYLN